MTENELLAAMLAEIAPMIEPDEVTAKMLQEAAGIGDKKAMDILRGKEAAGELTSRRVRLPEGRTATAWRRVV